MKKFERCLLDNGLTLLIQSLPSLTSASLGVVLNTGSRFENGAEAGLSHLLEHMMFQGTPRRDTRELSRVLNAVGGNLDAYTSRESTAYYAKVPAIHLELAMNVLADMLSHSSFTPRSLEKEKSVIYEEIRMYEDEPEELVHDLFSQTLWPKHALGRPIIGTRSQVKRHTRTGLRQYWQAHYRPERMLVSVAGNVSVDAVKKMTRRFFGSWPRESSFKRAPIQPVPPVRSTRSLTVRKQEQVHICLGTQSIPYSDPRRLALLGLSNVLGGGTNSRLFYEVRERRALAYSVYSFLDFYHDAGVAGVYAACHPRKTKETMEVIESEIHRLLTRPISRQEWLDLREQMKGNLLLSLENSSTHMWRMVQNEMYLKMHPTLKATLRAIERLSREEVQQVARDVFGVRPITVTAVGPIFPRQVGA
jgi:predicted Zn-dependent peptidase